MDVASRGVLRAIAAAERSSKRASRPDSTVSALTVTDIRRRHSSVMAPFPAAPLATGHLTRRSNQRSRKAECLYAEHFIDPAQYAGNGPDDDFGLLTQRATPGQKRSHSDSD